MIVVTPNERIEFETQSEYNAYINSLPKVWSKEAHLAEINAIHEAEYKRRLEAANYVNGWEVVACASDPTNEYYEEAKGLLAYWFDGWNAIETYGAAVTEQTAQDPQTFVNGL
jgi:hypothetical protein